MNGEECGNCKFWDPLEGLIGGMGSCRLHPPTLTVSETLESLKPRDWDQPVTQENAWCGDYYPAFAFTGEV